MVSLTNCRGAGAPVGGCSAETTACTTGAASVSVSRCRSRNLQRGFVSCARRPLASACSEPVPAGGVKRSQSDSSLCASPSVPPSAVAESRPSVFKVTRTRPILWLASTGTSASASTPSTLFASSTTTLECLLAAPSSNACMSSAVIGIWPRSMILRGLFGLPAALASSCTPSKPNGVPPPTLSTRTSASLD